MPFSQCSMSNLNFLGLIKGYFRFVSEVPLKFCHKRLVIKAMPADHKYFLTPYQRKKFWTT